MRRQISGFCLVLFFSATLAIPVSAEDWAIKADLAESCNCAIPCPCNFGSNPTHDYCEGTRLHEIKEGHYGTTDLAGVKLVVTFRMGEWSKVYVDQNATEEQMKAIEKLFPLAFQSFHQWGVLSTEKVSLSVERTSTKVSFSVPQSIVEMEMMKGAGGQPVKILNLPAPIFQDYTQYKSIKNSHQSKDKSFSYSGTTGFTSKWEVSGKE